MDRDEQEKLAKIQAEADAELRLFQKMQAEYHSPAPVGAILPDDGLEKIADGLKDLAQDVSEYHSEYNENRRADAIKAEKDKKHSFRHDFLVAAFSVALTLFLEHIHNVIEFVLEFFRSFS